MGHAGCTREVGGWYIYQDGLPPIIPREAYTPGESSLPSRIPSLLYTQGDPLPSMIPSLLTHPGRPSSQHDSLITNTHREAYPGYTPPYTPREAYPGYTPPTNPPQGDILGIHHPIYTTQGGILGIYYSNVHPVVYPRCSTCTPCGIP